MSESPLTMREAKEILLSNRIGFTQTVRDITVIRDDEEYTHKLIDGCIERAPFMEMVEKLAPEAEEEPAEEKSE